MQKLTLLSSPGRYEGSQSDCILLATNEDIQAINAGSPNVHINLHTVQKVDGGKGKMVGEQPCPIKYHKKQLEQLETCGTIFQLTYNNTIYYTVSHMDSLGHGSNSPRVHKQLV